MFVYYDHVHQSGNTNCVGQAAAVWQVEIEFYTPHVLATCALVGTHELYTNKCVVLLVCHAIRKKTTLKSSLQHLM